MFGDIPFNLERLKLEIDQERKHLKMEKAFLLIRSKHEKEPHLTESDTEGFLKLRKTELEKIEESNERFQILKKALRSCV